MGSACKTPIENKNTDIQTESQSQTRKPEEINDSMPPRIQEMEIQLEQSAQIVFTLKDKVELLQDQVQQLQQLLDQKANNIKMNELTGLPSNVISQPQFFTFHDKEQQGKDQHQHQNGVRKISIQEQLHPS